MLRKDLPTVEVTIDERYSQGENLGIDLISNVKNPAVKIKGTAFSNQDHSKYCFSDELKYRIGAPALVPDDIYRNDEDGEYFIRFTVDKIEQLAKKFMSELPTKGNRIFNLEHGSELIDSYILEAILENEMKKDNYSWITFALAVVFKRTDLSLAEHRDNAHIKHKSTLLNDITMDIALPYIVSISGEYLDNIKLLATIK